MPLPDDGNIRSRREPGRNSGKEKTTVTVKTVFSEYLETCGLPGGACDSVYSWGAFQGGCRNEKHFSGEAYARKRIIIVWKKPGSSGKILVVDDETKPWK